MTDALRTAALLPLLLLALSTPDMAARAQSASPVIQRFKGREVPPLTATDRDGHPVSQADGRGRIVIVNLWATWCAPCRVEMASLERLAALHPDDLTVLAISNDAKGWMAIDRFWGPQFAHLKVALASGPGLAEGLGAIGLPYSVILDRDGRELARVPQAVDWDRGEVRALIDGAVALKGERDGSR